MTSVQLIRKIDRREVMREEIKQILLDMPELECYRVLVWLAIGPKCYEEGSKELMIFLGRNATLYNKVLRWISPEEFYRHELHMKRPPQEPAAHEANGFEEYGDLLTSTKELVELVN